MMILKCLKQLKQAINYYIIVIIMISSTVDKKTSVRNNKVLLIKFELVWKKLHSRWNSISRYISLPSGQHISA